MKRNSLFSALTLTALLGLGVALPASASAHGHQQAERTTFAYGERRFAANHSSRHPVRHDYRHERGRGHKHGHHKHRRYREVREVREVHHYHERPVTVIEQRHEHRRDSGVRIHIGYDFTL